MLMPAMPITSTSSTTTTHTLATDFASFFMPTINLSFEVRIILCFTSRSKPQKHLSVSPCLTCLRVSAPQAYATFQNQPLPAAPKHGAFRATKARSMNMEFCFARSFILSVNHRAHIHFVSIPFVDSCRTRRAALNFSGAISIRNAVMDFANKNDFCNDRLSGYIFSSFE